MGKSQETFNKKEREKKRRKKKLEKLEKREARKLEKNNSGGSSLDDMIAYIDENGNISDSPPDPTKKKKVKVEDIVLGIPPKEDFEEDPVRTGKVKFFNEEKGYGFIIDNESKDSVFVHMNNCNADLHEKDRVTFELERSPKGLSAINVKLVE